MALLNEFMNKMKKFGMKVRKIWDEKRQFNKGQNWSRVCRIYRFALSTIVFGSSFLLEPPRFY